MANSESRIGRITNEKFSTTIVWTIRNYFSLSQKKDNHYYSPSFYLLNAKWYLEICPNGESQKGSVGWIGLYLRKQYSTWKTHHINYTLGIRDRYGTVYDSWSDKCRFQGNETGFGVHSFEQRFKITQKSDLLVPNNSLTVFCVINDKDHAWDPTSDTLETNDCESVSDKSDNAESTGETSRKDAECHESDNAESTGETSRKDAECHESDNAKSTGETSRNETDEFGDPKRLLPNQKGLDIFCRNLKDLLLSERFCDFKIRINGEEFRVHKAILAAHSPVFSAMFDNEMAEKNSGVVTITDSKPDDFREFLHYLYTGMVEEVSLMHVCGVYMLADKYDVKQLKEECVAIMNSGVSVDNFCDVISVAVKCDESELLKMATDYFVKNTKNILQTVKWQSFLVEAPIVANELFLKAMS